MSPLIDAAGWNEFDFAGVVILTHGASFCMQWRWSILEHEWHVQHHGGHKCVADKKYRKVLTCWHRIQHDVAFLPCCSHSLDVSGLSPAFWVIVFSSRDSDTVMPIFCNAELTLLMCFLQVLRFSELQKSVELVTSDRRSPWGDAVLITNRHGYEQKLFKLPICFSNLAVELQIICFLASLSVESCTCLPDNCPCELTAPIQSWRICYFGAGDSIINRGNKV